MRRIKQKEAIPIELYWRLEIKVKMQRDFRVQDMCFYTSFCLCLKDFVWYNLIHEDLPSVKLRGHSAVLVHTPPNYI